MVALLAAAASSPAASQSASAESFAAQVLDGVESMPAERFDRDRETDQWSRDVVRVTNLHYRIIEPGSSASPLAGEVTGRIESANACCFESRAQAAVGLPSAARAPVIHEFELRFEPGETGWLMVSGTVFVSPGDGTRARTRKFAGRAIQRGQTPAVEGPVGILAAHIEKHAAGRGVAASPVSAAAKAVKPRPQAHD